MPPHHILRGHHLPPSFEPSLGMPADAQGAVFTWVPSGGLTLSPRSPPPGGYCGLTGLDWLQWQIASTGLGPCLLLKAPVGTTHFLVVTWARG